MFINDVDDTDETTNIKRVVNLKNAELAEKIYDDMLNSDDIKKAIKLLKRNKAPGYDYISAEFIKCCDNEKLINILIIFFNMIVKYGLKLQRFNICLITPIPKKNKYI